MSHPAAPCHLDRVTATAVTEARVPTGAQRHVMDLLDLDPGHHALVRLCLADWRRVERVVAAIEATRSAVLYGSETCSTANGVSEGLSGAPGGAGKAARGIPGETTTRGAA